MYAHTTWHLPLPMFFDQIESCEVSRVKNKGRVNAFSLYIKCQ